MRTTYTAAVEVATKHALDVETLTPALSEYAPEVGTSAQGWLELRITLPASSLAQACSTALAMASAATGAEAISCEVMTESESHERDGSTPVPRMREPDSTVEVPRPRLRVPPALTG
jgi:hypothetical protein